jgi:adenylosuccinate synthase
LPEIRICTAYGYRGKTVDVFPLDARSEDTLEPIYETLPGWQSDTSGIARFEDLPPAARRYVERIEEITGVPVVIISLGPGRDSIIER